MAFITGSLSVTRHLTMNTSESKRGYYYRIDIVGTNTFPGELTDVCVGVCYLINNACNRNKTLKQGYVADLICDWPVFLF